MAYNERVIQIEKGSSTPIVIFGRMRNKPARHHGRMRFCMLKIILVSICGVKDRGNSDDTSSIHYHLT